MPRFCMGAGVAMGTTGLKWPGADGDDDCAMLWTGSLGVTSVARTALACAAVFFMAVLAQYLTTINGNRVQEAKARAKQLYAAAQNPIARMEQGATRYAAGGAAGQPKLERQCSSIEHECKHARREADPPVVAAGSGSMAAHWNEKLPASLRPLSPKRSTVSTKMNANGNVPRPQPVAAAPLEIPKVSNWEHLGDSALHGLRIFLAYLLMLAAMTYDVALLASIVAGFSAGFFWFAQDTAKVPASADPCCS